MERWLLCAVAITTADKRNAVPAQDTVLVQPTLQGPLHVRVGEARIAPAGVGQRHAQEPDLALGGREKLTVEAVPVVMSDVAEGQGQPPVERVRKDRKSVV